MTDALRQTLEQARDALSNAGNALMFLHTKSDEMRDTSVGEANKAIASITAAISQLDEALGVEPVVQWCEQCGELVTDFCRGKGDKCGYGFQRPGQATEPAPSTAGELQRYEPEIWREDRIRMEPDSLGDWVKFDDVAALLSAPALPVGESEAFEEWFLSHKLESFPKDYDKRRLDRWGEHYRPTAWDAWQGRARLAAARTQPERVPIADVDMRALYQQCGKEVAKLEAEDRYTFAAWFPIAIRLTENHHGITKKAQRSNQMTEQAKTSYLKKAVDTFKSWPTWAKVTFILFMIGLINGQLKLGYPTEAEMKAATERQEVKEKQRTQEDLENQAVALVHGMVKESLNDPSSVEWKGTFVYNNLDTCVNFSAKNGFNGRVKGFAAMIDGKFTVNNVKEWNKRCGDSGAVRYY